MPIFINGKQVDGNCGGGNGPKKDVKVIDSIAAGETFEHDGPVQVTNSIGAGATVRIKNGGLHVQGDIEDNCNVKVDIGSSSSSNVVISGNSISISGDFSGVSINGNSVTTGGNDDINGIQVDGVVGDDVSLVSNHNIDIESAGKNLQADAGHNFTSGNIGENSEVESGHNLTAGYLENGADLDSGHNLTISQLNHSSTARSGHSMTCGYIGQDCRVRAGHKLTAAEAHVTAKVKAGHKKKIGNTVGSENDTIAPSPEASTPATQEDKPKYRRIDRRNRGPNS